MLIAVDKDGQTIAVHPAALLAHLALGWRETGEAVAPDEATTEPAPDTPADTNGNGYLSVAEIRAALDERGIGYNPKAKRPELLALLKD